MTNTAKIWRLVDKKGNPVGASPAPLMEEQNLDFPEPLDLEKRLALADSSSPQDSPHKYQPFVPEAEALHWKANHDNQVARARVLLERPDLPLERVRAYGLIGTLQAKVDLLQKKLKGKFLGK